MNLIERRRRGLSETKSDYYAPCNYIVGCIGGYLLTDVAYSSSSNYVISGKMGLDDVNKVGGTSHANIGWDNGGWVAIHGSNSEEGTQGNKWQIGGSSDNYTSADSTPSIPKEFTLTINQSSHTTNLNVTNVGSCSRSNASLSAGAYLPYVLMGQLSEHGNVSSPQFYKADNLRVYHIKITVNGTVVHDFYPYVHNGTEGCLYDTITETYWHNNGSGTFGWG